jgi:heat shock protein HtpX
MGVGYFVGGRGGMLIALGIAAVMNFGMYWFSDKLVLKMQGAKPLDENAHPEIPRMVSELATADDLPMPKLYIMDTPIPNAFATGRSPKHAAVAVTTGIMDMLSYDELKAVLGHELGHVKNRDMLVSTVAATVAGAISFVVEMAFWSSLFGGGDDEEGSSNPFATIALMILAPLAAMLIQMAVSRSREYLADQHGAKLMGGGQHLASALAKIEGWKHNMPPLQASPTQNATAHLMFNNPFSARGLAGLFSTHPPTEKRIERLKNY